jgi:hypothetical protein
MGEKNDVDFGNLEGGDSEALVKVNVWDGIWRMFFWQLQSEVLTRAYIKRLSFHRAGRWGPN